MVRHATSMVHCVCSSSSRFFCPAPSSSSDCWAARDSNHNQVIKFAGVYCEHQATSYCQSGSQTSAHAFCTNGGECKRSVGRSEQHAGCKCPGGYEGDFCQFIKGSRPSDWTLDNFIHPSLAGVYENKQGSTGTNFLGLFVGCVVASALIVISVAGFICGPSLKEKLPALKEKLRRNEKEMDTAGDDDSKSLGGRRASGIMSPQNTSFVGGKSVYKKKNTTGPVVASDALEADGGALTDVLENQGLAEEDLVEVEQKTSMEEVDLDDERPGELA